MPGYRRIARLQALQPAGHAICSCLFLRCTRHLQLAVDYGEGKPPLDKVKRVAAELFDTAVNMGPETATGFLQRALNALNRAARDYPDIAVDREIGPRTLSALDGFLAARGKGGETILLRAMEALQGERYIALAERRPSQEAFLYGWLANRIGSDGA